MNRGLQGEAVFMTPEMKNIYLEILKEQSRLNRIRLLAYCLMDTHFHLVLENSSGFLSAFIKKVNSIYGTYYRHVQGGKGYVFHDRFKSTVIENDTYLLTAILYILSNPVRAGMVSDPFSYHWSSAKMYFDKQKNDFLDVEFVENLFGNKAGLASGLKNFNAAAFKEKNCRYGLVLGSDNFAEKAEKKYERRKMSAFDKNRRMEDKYFEPVKKVIYEFEKRIGKKIAEIDTTTLPGKRQRGELLVYLRDLCGLKYSQVAEFEYFRDLKFNSLGNLYGSTKKRLRQTK
jgi:REP element-mobilizing transposase RayT